MVRALSHVLFFNPGPERRVPSPNRYIADAKLCFCKNNKRMIIQGGQVSDWEESQMLAALAVSELPAALQ